MQKKITAIYPGTFDPITKGHLDIIKRASKIADKLVIGVSDNYSKKPMFSIEERIEMIKGALKEDREIPDNGKNFEIVHFNTLLMEFAENFDADLVIRGLRSVSDFEYEFQMTGINSYLSKKIETIFFMAKDRHQFVSSTFIKEISRLEGDISHFVTDNVVAQLKKKSIA